MGAWTLRLATRFQLPFAHFALIHFLCGDARPHELQNDASPAVWCIGPDVSFDRVLVQRVVWEDVLVAALFLVPFYTHCSAIYVVRQVRQVFVEKAKFLTFWLESFEVNVDLVLRSEVADGPGSGLGLVWTDKHDAGTVGQRLD